MQRGKDSGGAGPAASRQQRKQQQQLELHKFYRSFEEIKALVIWRVGGWAALTSCVCVFAAT